MKEVKLKSLLGILTVMGMACFCWNKAFANENLLEQEMAAIYVGDSLNLRDCVSESFLSYNYGDYNAENVGYNITYEWNNENAAPSCAKLENSTGMLTAVSDGTVKVDVTYTYKDVTETETISVELRSPEKIDAKYGDTITLDSAYVYDTSKYNYTFTENSVVLDDDGSIDILGFKDCDIYITGNNGKNIKVADVDVETPVFDDCGVIRAMGTESFIPKFKNYEAIENVEIEWNTGDANVAAVSDNKILALNEGTTSITARIESHLGDIVEVKSNITVTNPSFSEEEVAVAKNKTSKVTLNGICEYSVIDWNIGGNSSNKELSNGNDVYCAYFTEAGEVFGQYEGIENVKICVDGKVISCNVSVTDPEYSGSTIIMYKGGKRALNIKGIDTASSVVTYKSNNENIVTVDDKGVVNAKKAGKTKIIATADGKNIKISIEVCESKAFKAAMKAIAISKTKTVYSQANRMDKNKYDCSSLVWRVYSQYEIYFGKKSGWAPTAADIGLWCQKNGKAISLRALPATKLLPGDLVFYSYERNGRYKNISHVEMYTGNGKDVSASSRRNAVIHYDYNGSSSVVMIARPTK